MKRNNKVFLIKLPYLESNYAEYVDLPAGIGILSESLSHHGIEHDFYDMQLNDSTDALCDKIDEIQPEFIGFSMMTFKYSHNYELIDTVKKRFPDKKVIVGGPHATTFKEKVLEACRGVDIVALMEGEDTLVELCKGVPLDKVRGIIYRNGEKIVFNELRPFIEDLDKYPFPKLSKFDFKHYKSIPIISSRGCPYACIYCPVPTTIGKKWRPRNPEKIADELEYWVSRGFSKFQILDDNFTLDKKRVFALCDEIKTRGLEGKVNISLENGVRADRVDRELLEMMREVGFYCVAFGVESGNDNVLKILKKGEPLKAIEKAIRTACDLGYEVHLFFVIGTPGEKAEDVEQSIAVACRYDVTDVAFYHLIPFPGTELYRWVEENKKFRFKAPDFLNNASHWVNEPIFFTDELSAEERKRLYALANSKGRKHAHKSMNKKLALKASENMKMPLGIASAGVSLARSAMVQKYLKDTFVWKSIRKILRNR